MRFISHFTPSLVHPIELDRGAALPMPDQFPVSDFFKNDAGMELSDVNVFAKCQNDPELREQVSKYLTESTPASFDESTSDKEVFKSIGKLENDFLDKLSMINQRINDLQNGVTPPEEEK